MIPESVQVAIIGAISALLGGAGMWFLAYKKYPREIRVLKSEETENMARALNDATSAIANSLNAANKERETWEGEKKALYNRIDELEAHRNERSRMIYEIQQKQETSEREYVIKISSLDKEVTDLHTEISEVKKKNMTYREIIEKLVDVLKKVDPKLLDGIDLTETLEKIKAIK